MHPWGGHLCLHVTLDPRLEHWPSSLPWNSNYCFRVALHPGGIIKFQELRRKCTWLMVSITSEDTDKCSVAGLQPVILRSWIKVPPSNLSPPPPSHIVSHVSLFQVCLRHQRFNCMFCAFWKDSPSYSGLALFLYFTITTNNSHNNLLA